MFRNSFLKSIACLLVIVMMLPLGMQESSAATKVMYGDVNRDEVVTAKDALVILQYVVGDKLLSTAAKQAAELNGDEEINAEDALLILEYVVGLREKFPIEDMLPTTLYIIGDSIAAYHDKTGYERPLYGWGETIGAFYSDELMIENKAVSSMSSSSYYTLKRQHYNAVYDNIREGDYVIISFGHNDHNDAPIGNVDRCTNPEASTTTKNSFKWWLKNYYIDPALKEGATPILMSSVVRCTFTNGVFTEETIHLKYGKAMKELVAEYAKQGITIYMIDATTYTYNLYKEIGETKAKLYHGLGQPSWGQWYFDNTHYSYDGAMMISEFISSELAKLPLDINEFLLEQQ